MPLGDQLFQRDLYGETRGNQAQPLLISTHGRYVWCEQPFAFRFDSGMLHLSARAGHIVTGKAGTDLRDAYLFVSPDSATSRLLAGKDMLLKQSGKGLYVPRWWNGYSAVVDCSNDQALAWFRQQLTDLVDRYAQCSALMPMMQFSVAPWRVLDAPRQALCLEAARSHARMGKEILALARESAKTGAPILRPLEYVFPHRGYATIHDQFMLGNKILIAPVVHRGATRRSVSFPPGRWVGDDGSTVVGPSVVEVDAPIDRYEGKALYEWIVLAARKHGLAGATVLRGLEKVEIRF
jgi:hypothetical protein